MQVATNRGHLGPLTHPYLDLWYSSLTADGSLCDETAVVHTLHGQTCSQWQWEHHIIEFLPLLNWIRNLQLFFKIRLTLCDCLAKTNVNKLSLVVLIYWSIEQCFGAMCFLVSVETCLLAKCNYSTILYHIAWNIASLKSFGSLEWFEVCLRLMESSLFCYGHPH